VPPSRLGHIDLIRHPGRFIFRSRDNLFPSFKDMDFFAPSFPQSYFNRVALVPLLRLAAFNAAAVAGCLRILLSLFHSFLLIHISLSCFLCLRLCFFRIFSYPDNDLLSYINLFYSI